MRKCHKRMINVETMHIQNGSVDGQLISEIYQYNFYFAGFKSMGLNQNLNYSRSMTSAQPTSLFLADTDIFGISRPILMYLNAKIKRSIFD